MTEFSKKLPHADFGLGQDSCMSDVIFYEDIFPDPQWLFLAEVFPPESLPHSIINLMGSGGNGMRNSLTSLNEARSALTPSIPIGCASLMELQN